MFAIAALEVAHPCDEASLGAALSAASMQIIEPILVGPPEKILAAASALKEDISRFRIVEAAHSHEAADKAVALVKAGEAEALMKGSLHTDELMACGCSSGGWAFERRAGSAIAFVMDVPVMRQCSS